MAEEVGDSPYNYGVDTALLFYCECADIKCHERIPMTLETYNDVHQNKKAFVIIAGHDVDAIERVAGKTPDYWIVEKFVEPSSTLSAAGGRFKIALYCSFGAIIGHLLPNLAMAQLVPMVSDRAPRAW